MSMRDDHIAPFFCMLFFEKGLFLCLEEVCPPAPKSAVWR